MSARATTWVWQYSQAKGIDRLVMLAIADEASDNGRFSSSVATLARKSGVDARTVQRALHRLDQIGELSKPLEGQRGPRGTYVYRVLFDDRPQALTPGRESPPAESHPRQSAVNKTGQEGATESPPPAERRTSSTKNNPQTAPQSSGVAAEETEGQRANRLTKIYTDLVPMSRFPAVAGIVRKAIRAQHSDRAITDALVRLAGDGRSVTVETLRIELEGLPASRRPVRNFQAEREQQIQEKVTARQSDRLSSAR